MSDVIRLQLLAPEGTRKALKIEAAKQDVEMSELGVILLDFGLELLSSGKMPASVAKALQELKDKKSTEDGPAKGRRR